MSEPISNDVLLTRLDGLQQHFDSRLRTLSEQFADVTRRQDRDRDAAERRYVAREIYESELRSLRKDMADVESALHDAEEWRKRFQLAGFVFLIGLIGTLVTAILGIASM